MKIDLILCLVVLGVVLAGVPPVQAEQQADQLADQLADQEQPSAPPSEKAPATSQPVLTSDSSQVTVGHIHNVFERNGDVFRVSQTLRLMAAKGVIYKGKDGYPVPLPASARAPRVLDENKHLYKVTGDKIYYMPSIVTEGRDVSIGFDLPIAEGSAVLEQDFGKPVRSAQVISIWTAGKTQFSGSGFEEAQMRELNSGLQAIVMNATDIKNGKLKIVVSGLAAIDGVVLRWITLVAAIGMLALGVVFWLRRRVVSPT